MTLSALPSHGRSDAGVGNTPLPSSVVESVPITGISFDEASHNRFDNNGDIFPVTWHDDGHIYTMGGDGDGWDGTDTRGLDVNRLDEVGPDGDLSAGTETFSKVDLLPDGIISIDGTLYWFAEERGDADGDGGSFEDLMIARSTDDGATWEYLTGGDPTNDADYAYNFTSDGRLTHFRPVQMGKSYSTWWDASYGGEGDYVYMTTQNGSSGAFLLRAPRSADLRDPANHEWLSGIDGNNNASWSSNQADAVEMYTEGSTDVHWGLAVTWNEPLNRFLLTHFDDANTGVLTVAEGPTPWGPWTEIYNSQLPGALGDSIEKYGFFPVNKRGVSGVTDWLSSDGLTWWCVLSGMDEWDSFNTIEATLVT